VNTVMTTSGPVWQDSLEQLCNYHLFKEDLAVSPILKSIFVKLLVNICEYNGQDMCLWPSAMS
jgi:hypothetical protein